jgi:hypothetical protein
MLTMTLDAELRYTLAGGGGIHLRGWAERARTLAAVWYMLDDFTRDLVHASFHCLREGTACGSTAVRAPETRAARKLRIRRAVSGRS